MRIAIESWCQPRTQGEVDEAASYYMNRRTADVYIQNAYSACLDSTSERVQRFEREYHEHCALPPAQPHSGRYMRIAFTTSQTRPPASATTQSLHAAE